MANAFSQFDEQSKENPFAQFHKDDSEPTTAPKPPEQPGFMSRVGGDIMNRANEGADAIVSYKNKEQGLPATALDLVGKMGAGTTADIMGEGAKSVASYVPDDVKIPLKNIGHIMLNTDTGKAGVNALMQGEDIYKKWAKENPNAARHIESVIDIGGVLPPAKAAVKSVEAAAPVVKEAAKKVGEGAENLASKAIPKIDPGLLPVVDLAKKHGIPLSLDEVTGSRALKAIQKAGQDLPFSGQQAFREKQMSAWNKGILKTVGANGERITPEVMKERFSDLGKKFDNLGAGKTFSVKGGFQKGIQDIVNEAQATTTKDAVANLKQSINDILKNADKKTGEISGEKLGEIRKKINKRMRETDNYDTKVLLGNLENHIIDAMTADPKIAKEFGKTKQQYKNLIALEPLVQKGKAGNISPTGLRNRIAKMYGRSYTTGQAGDIGELARVGGELLPELGGSDTQTKALYSMGAGGAALAHPLATGGVLGGNRLFQDFINRNQSLIQKARP